MRAKNTVRPLLYGLMLLGMWSLPAAAWSQEPPKTSWTNLVYWSAGSPDAVTFVASRSAPALRFSLLERPITLTPEAPVLARLKTAFCAEDLPFFCRVEYRLARKVSTPFKFRLGSVEYVDWLEGKPGVWSPGTGR